MNGMRYTVVEMVLWIITWKLIVGDQMQKPYGMIWLTPANWWTKNRGPNGSNVCNLLKGSDGQQFPPYVRDTDKLYIFQTDVCRSLFISYEKDKDINGINTLRFVAPSIALQVNTTTNAGFCMEMEPDVPWEFCIQNTADPEILDLTNCFENESYSGHCYDGTLDITKCMKNAPIVMSSPHFYQVNWMKI